MFKPKKGFILGELWTQLALLIVVIIALVILWALLIGLKPKEVGKDLDKLENLFQNENYYNLKFFLEENSDLIREFLISQDKESEEKLKQALDSTFDNKKYSFKLYYDANEFVLGKKYSKYDVNLPFFVKENKIARIYFENEIRD